MPKRLRKERERSENTDAGTGADTPTGEDEMRSIARASIAGRKASRTLGCGWVGEGAS